jgi:flavin-dependent dehydrogenase
MHKQAFTQKMGSQPQARPPRLILKDGARVAVMGGGPAGSFFSYFLLNIAQRVGLRLHVDIYEPRDFSLAGPPGCNMDAGIISESLVQNLASEGIVLPPTVVRRGIDAYTLHMGVESARLDAPRHEKRIATISRGAGPRGEKSVGRSFDGYLLAQAKRMGANVIRGRVDEVQRVEDGRLRVAARGHTPQVYDLLAVAVGVKTSMLKLFEPAAPGYRPPVTAQVSMREYRLGAEVVERHFGNAIRAFLLDVPGLDFAALVPKGDYVTATLVGHGEPDVLMNAFLNSPEVKQQMPPGWKPEQAVCHCSPRLNITGAVRPFADRLVFIGDSGVSRLYKDGIGAAYRAAKAAVTTVLFHGLGAEDFRRHYWPMCRRMAFDNRIGKLVFAVAHQIPRLRFARRAVLHMLAAEQQRRLAERRMSAVLWDIFTGSAPYREIFLRTLHPAFWTRLLWHLAVSVFNPPDTRRPSTATSDSVLAL